MKSVATTDVPKGREVAEIKRQPMIVQGPNILSDTGKFEHLQRVATLMAQANLVPEHLRGSIGDCFMVCQQADRWQMDPFAVAQKTFVIKSRLGYEAQLVAAVINSRAPLKTRLNTRYEGEGADLVCTVWATMEGETDPREKSSPPLSQITTRNSPMWTVDPAQQLGYWTQRAWARLHAPDVLLGVYTQDELETIDLERRSDGVYAPTTGPRPSRHNLVAHEEPVETYPLVDHIGEVESRAAYPEQWAKELLAASAPTVDNRFTDKAIGYLVNNAEACEAMYPLIKDDALVTALQARYAAAEDQRAEVPGGTGAVGDAEGSPAAATKEITASASTAPPVVADAAGGPSPAGSPAAPPAPAQEAPPPVAPEPPKPQPAPAAPPEGPKAIPMPKSARTGKPDSGAYLLAIQQEMALATQAEHVDMILTREGYLGPRKYAPGSNLAAIMNQTSGSIEMFATRRKLTIANGQA